MSSGLRLQLIELITNDVIRNLNLEKSVQYKDIYSRVFASYQDTDILDLQKLYALILDSSTDLKLICDTVVSGTILDPIKSIIADYPSTKSTVSNQFLVKNEKPKETDTPLSNKSYELINSISDSLAENLKLSTSDKVKMKGYLFKEGKKYTENEIEALNQVIVTMKSGRELITFCNQINSNTVLDPIKDIIKTYEPSFRKKLKDESFKKIKSETSTNPISLKTFFAFLISRIKSWREEKDISSKKSNYVDSVHKDVKSTVLDPKTSLSFRNKVINSTGSEEDKEGYDTKEDNDTKKRPLY